MKQNNSYKILLFLLIIIGTWSCERDDICADTTATTPHLIIRFYDLSNPLLLKSVDDLSVRALDEDGIRMAEIPVGQPYDSISIPLRFQDQPTFTRFEIEKNTRFRLDTIDATNSNIDVITVNYTPEFKFVSQACGYKSIFTNVSVSIEQDGDNWIKALEILNTTIENENQAQVILRH